MELRNAETWGTGTNPGQQHSGRVGSRILHCLPRGFLSHRSHIRVVMVRPCRQLPVGIPHWGMPTPRTVSGSGQVRLGARPVVSAAVGKVNSKEQVL